MGLSINVVKKTLLCVAAFCVAAILSALIGRMIVSAMRYSPVIQELGDLSANGYASLAASVAGRSAVKLLLIFVGGFTLFDFPASLLISMYRGAAIGYTASLISGGQVLLSGNRICTVGDVWQMLLMFTLSSAVLFIMSSASLSFSESSYSVRPSLSATLRYVSVFLVLSGVTVIFDLIAYWFLIKS